MKIYTTDRFELTKEEIFQLIKIHYNVEFDKDEYLTTPDGRNVLTLYITLKSEKSV